MLLQTFCLFAVVNVGSLLPIVSNHHVIRSSMQTLLLLPVWLFAGHTTVSLIPIVSKLCEEVACKKLLLLHIWLFAGLGCGSINPVAGKHCVAIGSMQKYAVANSFGCSLS